MEAGDGTAQHRVEQAVVELDDIRNNDEVAFHTAWRVWLSQDVPEKQDYVAYVSQIVEDLAGQYEAKTLEPVDVFMSR